PPYILFARQCHHQYMSSVPTLRSSDLVNHKRLNAEIITPVFKDCKNGKYKIISFYAKKARGMMCAYIIRNRIKDIEEIKNFDTEGYRYSAASSSANQWVFTREELV